MATDLREALARRLEAALSKAWDENGSNISLLADVARRTVEAWALEPEQIERAASAVYAEFYGGSSGLDDMAEAIARDHARAALQSLFGGGNDK